MPKFSSRVAEILQKDPKAMKWILETDKQMAMVTRNFFWAICPWFNSAKQFQGCEPEGASKTFFLVEIDSIKVFQEKDDCIRYVPQISNFVQQETNLKQEEVVTIFRNLEAHHVGANGMTMFEKMQQQK